MEYELLLTAPGGGSVRDLRQLVQTMTWSGSVDQAARELTAVLAVPRDKSVEPPPLEEGALLTLRFDGADRFTGPLLSVTTTSQSVLTDLSALDRGRYLVGNEGWYRFDGVTPEAAVRTIAGDFSLPLGGVAAAGVTVRRKFPGVSLDRILRTMYALAGEQTGKRYLIRFTGDGRLETVERPTAASLTIASTMSVSNTWDITDLSNSVAIRTESGALVRRVEDEASAARSGRLEHVIVQRQGEDAGAEAQAWLRDNGLAQLLTVETLGDPRLIAGEAVILRDTGSGVSGLFWIDADTHTWKNGQYYTKATLNFRNLLDDVSAGSDIT